MVTGSTFGNNFIFSFYCLKCTMTISKMGLLQQLNTDGWQSLGREEECQCPWGIALRSIWKAEHDYQENDVLTLKPPFLDVLNTSLPLDWKKEAEYWLVKHTEDMLPPVGELQYLDSIILIRRTTCSWNMTAFQMLWKHTRNMWGKGVQVYLWKGACFYLGIFLLRKMPSVPLIHM